CPAAGSLNEVAGFLPMDWKRSVHLTNPLHIGTANLSHGDEWPHGSRCCPPRSAERGLRAEPELSFCVSPAERRALLARRDRRAAVVRRVAVRSVPAGMPPARRDRLRRRPPGAAPPQPSALHRRSRRRRTAAAVGAAPPQPPALHRLSRRRCTASAAGAAPPQPPGAAPPQPPAPQRAQPPSARMISRQKAGKSGGVRDVMTLPSTTTSSSTYVAPAWTMSSRMLRTQVAR